MFAMPRKSGTLGGVALSVVEYVIYILPCEDTPTSSFLETARKARYLGEPTTRNRLTALLTPAAKALARSREKKEAFLRFLTPVRIFSQSLGSNAKTRGANRNAGAY